MEDIRSWVEGSPYSAFLGVRLESLGDTRARLHLPYRDENSNPGKALHGGCAASLGTIGGQTLARTVLGAESGPWHTCGMQVSYLSAAIGEDVIAEAKLLRRGKELCFVGVSVETLDGKPVASVTTSVRGRFQAEPAQTFSTRGDCGEADPGPRGPHIGGVPFI